MAKQVVKRSIKIGKHVIGISNEEKIIFPQDNITKGQLVDYYRRIAPTMVPHLRSRPLTMQRFPNGITSEGFFQKDASDYFPSWIYTKAVKRKEGGVVRYVVCNDAATLVYLANQLCITPHVWLSTVDALRYPDRMIFDLDPSGTDFNAVMYVARQLKNILEKQRLVPFVMTTGSRGLHVVVPLKPTATYTTVRRRSREIANQVVNENPELCTVEIRKKERRGRIFVDYLRNGFGATVVAPYAVRIHHRAPVATPLVWSEVKKGLSPQQYTIATIFRRLARRADPWAHINRYARSLSSRDVMKKIIVSIVCIVYGNGIVVRAADVQVSQPDSMTVNVVNKNKPTIVNQNNPTINVMGKDDPFNASSPEELKFRMRCLSHEQLQEKLATIDNLQLKLFLNTLCSGESQGLLKLLGNQGQSYVIAKRGSRYFLNTIEDNIAQEKKREKERLALEKENEALRQKIKSGFVGILLMFMGVIAGVAIYE